MLQKQKTNVEKEKTKKGVSKEILEELHLKPCIQFKDLVAPPKPPRVKGFIYKLGQVLGGKNKRYFEMNPIEGTIIKYMSKQDYPKNPKETYCIAEIQGLTRSAPTSPQKFHFFEVIIFKIKFH